MIMKVMEVLKGLMGFESTRGQVCPLDVCDPWDFVEGIPQKGECVMEGHDILK